MWLYIYERTDYKVQEFSDNAEHHNDWKYRYNMKWRLNFEYTRNGY